MSFFPPVRLEVVSLDYLQVVNQIQASHVMAECNAEVSSLRSLADQVAAMFKLQVSGLESQTPGGLLIKRKRFPLVVQMSRASGMTLGSAQSESRLSLVN